MIAFSAAREKETLYLLDRVVILDDSTLELRLKLVAGSSARRVEGAVRKLYFRREQAIVARRLTVIFQKMRRN